jgi:hypothetical protein
MNQFLRARLALLLALAMVAQTGAWAESKPLELKWNELAPLISGNRVELELKDASKVRGEAVAVREDGIVVDVKKPTSAYKKGNAVIPRDSLTRIRLERRRGSWGRSLGVTLGLISGLAVGGYTAAVTADSAAAGISIFIVIASAATIAGYALGRGLDKRVTVIQVVP